MTLELEEVGDADAPLQYRQKLLEKWLTTFPGQTTVSGACTPNARYLQVRTVQKTGAVNYIYEVQACVGDAVYAVGGGKTMDEATEWLLYRLGLTQTTTTGI